MDVCVTSAVLAALINRDVLWTMAVRIAVAFGGVLASVLTARYLSPASRGDYFLVYTLAQTLAQFGNLGLHSSNTYLVAQDNALAGALLANSLWTALIAGGLGSSIVVLLLRTDGAWAVNGLWLTTVLTPAILFYLLGANLLVGLRQIATFNKIQLAGSYLVLLCLTVAAIAGAGPAGFLAASAFGWSLMSGVLLLVLRQGAVSSFRFRPEVFLNGLRFALKAYAAALFAFLVVRGNVFLLNELKSSQQVGYYSVASQVADAMTILPQSVALVLFPMLVIAGGGQFRVTLKNMAAVGVLLAAACITVGVFAEPFVRVVFGENFLPSVPALRWLLPSVFCLGLTSIASQYLAAFGFPISVVLVWLAGVAISLSLGWLLIPLRGEVGAAMATSVAHLCMLVAIFVLCVRHARANGGGFESKAVATVDGAL